VRISELADETGVSIPSLKYYLREGLLHPGRPVSATRAEYDDSHVERVRLIRALVDVAGMSISDVRAVVATIEHPPDSRHEVLGTAHGALPAPGRNHAITEDVQRLVDGMGWRVDPDATALHTLSAAMEAARSAGLALRDDTLTAYARGCEEIARTDVAEAMRSRTLAEAIETVAVGTVLVDPILAALRRLAQEHVSAVGPEVRRPPADPPPGR
jgi:DNA-binding transcriptional MerR regulator